EHDVDAGVLGEAGAGRVVGGDRDDLVAARLHRGELGERQLAGGWGTHLLPPWSSGTLSISRTEPTRTAPARTGGSKGATSTYSTSRPWSISRASARSRVARARGRASATERSPSERSEFRDERASPSPSRTVGTTLRSISRSRSRTILRTTSTCCASFWP